MTFVTGSRPDHLDVREHPASCLCRIDRCDRPRTTVLCVAGREVQRPTRLRLMAVEQEPPKPADRVTERVGVGGPWLERVGERGGGPPRAEPARGGAGPAAVSTAARRGPRHRCQRGCRRELGDACPLESERRDRVDAVPSTAIASARPSDPLVQARARSSNARTASPSRRAGGDMVGRSAASKCGAAGAGKSALSCRYSAREYCGSHDWSRSGSSSTGGPGNSMPVRSSPRTTRSWAVSTADGPEVRCGSSSAHVWVDAATSGNGPSAKRPVPSTNTDAANGPGASSASRYSAWVATGQS